MRRGWFDTVGDNGDVVAVDGIDFFDFGAGEIGNADNVFGLGK